MQLSGYLQTKIAKKNHPIEKNAIQHKNIDIILTDINLTSKKDAHWRHLLLGKTF